MAGSPAAARSTSVLLRPPPEARARVGLDEHQRAVVDHRGGPLLVLAGPGTGKTTTLVEAVAARVEDPVAPLDPGEILVLTFSRKAAGELRDRITTRLGRTTSGAAAWTFHSFCYALIRADRSDRDDPAYRADRGPGEALRLLSGPEQEVAVRELLRGTAGAGPGSTAEGPWPETLRGCLTTRGFADEVRAVLARTRELGLDPADLADVAQQAGRGDWAAAAAFLEEYLDVLDARGALDYAELVHRAALLVERPDRQAELRRRYRAVFVDEYQDTDPAQERLLRALAGGGGDLVVVGDPDQSIYAFRGADVSAILEFRHRFPRLDGSPAPVRMLRCSRRSGPVLLAASRAVATRMGLPGLPVDVMRAHRALEAPAGGDPGDPGDPGEVEVLTYPSASAELEAVADLLRRSHLEDGVPWADMAVLVRSGVRAIPLVRRVLGAAGVPVEVAGDELPLAREPAVAPLLLALRCALDPAELSAERAETLLLSPLGGADGATLRRLGRQLLAADRLTGQRGPGTPPRSSAELVRAALLEPAMLDAVDEAASGASRRLATLLRATREALTAGDSSPEEALWMLWSGTRWPRRLERAAAEGGATGRAADRDLDAVCALFDTVARSEERQGHRGARVLLEELEAQAIPGDTLAERAVRGSAVRVLTAHRAKGLEWALVVVPGVQEGVWPDLRRRGSLLEPDRLGRAGLSEPATLAERLAEERRLFYVAVTRARSRVVVTAVASAEDDGERPSRFLEELGVPVRHVAGRVRRPLTISGLVGELRATSIDPTVSPGLRAAAVSRLARLAAASDDTGRPFVPSAHPRRWWGTAQLTDPGRPLHDPGQPLRLSGSSLSGLQRCALQWFLEHEAGATLPPSSASGFGKLLHVLAHELASGVLPADLDALQARLDLVWDSLPYEAAWQSAQERELARGALTRLLDWHRHGRQLLASEHPFAVTVSTEAGPVVLRGSMDRVERDEDGRVHVVDYKTGKTKPVQGEVDRHPQLGVYQLAVAEGALGDLPGGGRPELGGAELMHLRLAGKAGAPSVQRQPPLDRDGGTSWVQEALAGAAGRVLAETFPPMPSEACDRCAFRRCCPARPEGRQVVE